MCKGHDYIKGQVKSSFERAEKGLYYSEIIMFRVDEALKIPRNTAEVNVVQKVTTSSTREIFVQLARCVECSVRI